MYLLLAMSVTFLGSAGAPDRAEATQAACSRRTFDGDRFLVCRYRPETDEIRLVRRGETGRPGSMKELQTSLGADSTRVRFAMNAGMYHPDHSPVGLYIAAGRVERPLERAAGSGNFYMLPNGVFWVDDQGTPHVDETATFAGRAVHPRWATQSGPLLLNRGALHPAISENGPSRTVRNGVGIRGRKALFVISEAPVSFGRLARFFRDGLGCRDALYLDGTVSSLWAPDLGRQDGRIDLGTFIVILRR